LHHVPGVQVVKWQRRTKKTVSGMVFRPAVDVFGHRE
jgi:hypothetical protein